MYHQQNIKRNSTLDYLQSMLGQLKAMADSEGCDMLAYLIEMAHIEARDIMRGDTTDRQGPAG